MPQKVEREESTQNERLGKRGKRSEYVKLTKRYIRA